MSDELANVDSNSDYQIPEGLQLQTATDSDILAVSTSGDFLPRLQVCGSATELVKEGKIAMGVHAIVYTKDKYEELGKEVPFLSMSWRTKALRIPGGGANPISYFNRMSDEFKRVMLDSQGENSGCLFGPEFLIWLPTPGCFATYFFGTKTLRRAAPALVNVMKIGEENGKAKYGPRPALSKINFIKTAKYSWHGAIITPYSTPLPPPTEDYEQTVADVVKRFLNPKESQVEVAEPAASDRAR